MKGQILIRKVEQGLNNGAAQHLLGTHAIGPFAMGNIFTLGKILKNPIADDRVGINDVADDFELFALGMVCYWVDQGHFFCHFSRIL